MSLGIDYNIHQAIADGLAEELAPFPGYRWDSKKIVGVGWTVDLIDHRWNRNNLIPVRFRLGDNNIIASPVSNVPVSTYSYDDPDLITYLNSYAARIIQHYKVLYDPPSDSCRAS